MLIGNGDLELALFVERVDRNRFQRRLQPKDIDIYGVTGAVKVADRNTLQLQTADGKVHDLEPPPLDPRYREPIAYFAAVVRGEISEHPLSSLETNVIVTEILDAARLSARSGRSVQLPEKPGE
jgi:predicted dehydrogenase